MKISSAGPSAKHREHFPSVEDPSMPRPRKYPPELLDRGARVVIEVAGRSRMWRAISACRRRRCAIRCAGSRPTRAGGRICPRARSARRSSSYAKRSTSCGARTRSSRRRRVIRDRARRRPSEVSRFIGRFGVESICRVLGVSASAYYQRASGQRSARAVEDERLLERIECVHAANYHCYGYRRSRLALKREGGRAPARREDRGFGQQDRSRCSR
jgi:hypothetical protein